MNTILDRWSKWFLNFLHINMMLSVISLPFLCAWGLPVSWISVVGNLIFGPFLALFLLISSCLFFAHLLGFSAPLVGKLLNILCTVWIKLLSFGSPFFLAALAEHMLWLCITCAAIAFITLHHKKWGRPLQHTAILCGLVLVVALGCFIQEKSYVTHALYNKRKMVLITKKDSLLTLEDRGGLTEKRSPVSFVQFSLIPTLCKKTGSVTVDKLVLHKLSARTILALQQLQHTVRIKEIVYVPQRKSKTDYTEILEKLGAIAPVTIETVTPIKKKGAKKTPSYNLN